MSCGAGTETHWQYIITAQDYRNTIQIQFYGTKCNLEITLWTQEDESEKNLTRGNRQLLKVDRFSCFVSSDCTLVLLQEGRD